MTVSLGVNYGLVSTLVFLLGMALAGVAGVIGAPITGAYPSMGDNLLLLTLIVVVVGGTGYIQGTMLGALVIGLLDTFGKAYVPKVALFFAYIVFLDRAARAAERAHRKEGVLMSTGPKSRTSRPSPAAVADGGAGRRGVEAHVADLSAIAVIGVIVLLLPLFIPSWRRQPGHAR